MESLPNHEILRFHPDTLENIRKLYDLDKPGRMKQAVDILEMWVKKQNHFVKKDFSRDFLERTIITTKGSIERAKERLDKLCTLKTLMPNYFKSIDAKNDFAEVLTIVNGVPLPKLTKDDYRVFILKSCGKPLTSSNFTEYYKFTVILSEHLIVNDYCCGFIGIIDYSELNIMELLTCINPVDMRQAVTLFMDGYGMRLKGLHMITQSKMVDSLVTFLKQILSPKISSRIHVHRSVESVFEFVPQDCFPSDYGGPEKSMAELQAQWLDVLSCPNNVSILQESYKACTDESKRSSGKFNEEYLGMPGSFRTLTVD